MEPANIDWKTVDSRYVPDDLFEHINAPKWIDLARPDSAAPGDDDAWFCRPDCRHPKTAEDYQQRWTPTPSPKVKLMRSSSEVSPLGERNTNNLHRDAALKRRGGIGAGTLVPSPPARGKACTKKFIGDLENQDPNLVTPPPSGRQFGAPLGRKVAKEAVKSSADKKVVGDRGEVELEHKKPQRVLRSTLSARNLFSGKDILSQISEFCHELKKMAIRKERSAVGAELKKDEEKKGLLEDKEEEEGATVQNVNLNPDKNDGSAKKSTRPPLSIVTGKEKCSTKGGSDERLSVLRVVRAYPPTPQRIPSPSSRNPRKAKAPATTNSSPLNKPPKSAAQERRMLKEIEPNREEKEALVAIDEGCNRDSALQDVEGRAVDVFWLFKPCSYLV